MKKMKCLDCSEEFEAETPDEMLKTMLPHYMEKHQEIMKTNTDESKADWMKRFHKEWEESKEI
tara:strand:- start:423 stop:611 length:189 start_codon:yes stop_codon:yes gene_type:complete